MGYTVPNLATAKNTVLANSVALLVVYGVNFFCQFLVTCCFRKDQAEKARTLERILQTSRVLYWFAIATMFSVYPPFYYGTHSAVIGWLSVVIVLLMHIFCFVRRCDRQRSVWSYFYYFYHFMVGIWILAAMIVGYNQSGKQDVPSDSQQN